MLAIVGIAAMALQYFMPAPWEGTVSQLFFFAMAFNFAVWPNGRGVSPLASRVVGGAAVIILLINLITYIRHL